MSELTNEQIMSIVCRETDTLDCTRVSELENGKWKATTTFDSDEALLRCIRAVLNASLSSPSEAVALPQNRSEFFTLFWNLWNTYAPQYCGNDMVALERVATAMLALERREPAERTESGLAQFMPPSRDFDGSIIPPEHTVPKRLAPLCEEHGSGRGARSGCPYCAIIKLTAALSKIDYLCGPPNEMQCSGYDVHCDENAVVEHVRLALSTQPPTRD